MSVKSPITNNQSSNNIQFPNLKHRLVGHRLLIIGICLVIGNWLLVIPSYASTVKILNVEAKRMGDYAEVTVHTSENAKPQILLLESPNRIALSFDNATIESTITIPGPSSFIRIIQAAQIDPNTVYVIVEPNEELTYDYTSIIGKNKVILELTKAKPSSMKKIIPSPPITQEAAAMPTQTTIEVTEEVKLVETITKPVIVKAVATKEAVKPVKKVQATKEAVVSKKVEKPAKVKKGKVEPKILKSPLLGKIIVIDPGHGGKDPGYIGRYGTLEKNLTYKVALRLKRLLRESGATVYLTRYSDISVKNSKIVEIANSKNADIFIALHFNSFTSSRTGGCETFYYTPWSKTLAKVVQKNVCRVTKRRNRGVKKDMYYTVHHTNMPSVLVEPAYLTNPKEEKLILNPVFQENVALGIYKGIKEYVKIASVWQKSR